MTAPLQAGAPWPTFRRTIRNSGSSPIRGRYQGDQPWYFQTGKGIFSTPVIDVDGVVYTGSADHNFYAINPDGSEKWRFQTGEVIDSAAALPAGQPRSVLVPSGDGYLYCLNSTDGSERWRFDARVAPRESYNNWFEANVTLGIDGTIYAGNTNFNYYALSPEGDLKWTYETNSNAWSAGAIGQDGTLYWGSCDTFFHAVSPDGKSRWKRRSLGFISASMAVGSDGTVYGGSFDSYFYALNPESGKTLWRYKTQDHIYGSAALLEEDFETRLIVIGSTDGILYAFNHQGEVVWLFDSGAPIRSSPVIGLAPNREEGHIVYFGNSDGKLYALNAQNGRRRWSYDTTGAGDALADRNDLNGSPALGLSGLYIGGEHGQLWYLPYDYPIHNPADPRGCTNPNEELPTELHTLYFVSPGGRVLPQMPESLPAATLICLKLVIREKGETLPARFYNSPFFQRSGALKIEFDPPISFRHEVSGDGRYLYLIPDSFLDSGANYKLLVAGSYYLGGFNIGNLTIGGRSAGKFSRQFTFSIESSRGDLPLRMTPNEVTAFEWTRLSVPIPPMLASLNQIGFDYMSWLIAPVLINPPEHDNRRKVILWATGSKRNKSGDIVIDPGSDFRLPLSGHFLDDAFIITNRNFKMAVTGIPIPFNIFQLRGRMAPDLRLYPGARAFAETQVLSIPTFGIPMVIAGLANKIWKKLLALATYITRPYTEEGTANKKPNGVSVESIEFDPGDRSRPGFVKVGIRVDDGHSYPLADHLGAILLVDMAKSEVVELDYNHHLEQEADKLGNLNQIRLALPKGKSLPEETTVFVILDLFTIHVSKLG